MIESNLLQKYKQIKTFIPDTLFPIDFSVVKEMQCPKCGNKLKLMRRGGVICRGVKHAKAFVLTKNQFNEICKNKIGKVQK